MSKLKLYNTLNRRVEEFKPLNPQNVGYYSCGPTVYDYAHIGHARTYIFADILQRTLEFNGFKVKRVMNITDVGHLTSDSDTGEDKMELASRRSGKGASREKKTVWEIAKFYSDDFMHTLNKLNIKKPDIICRATEEIKAMIGLVKTLEDKGFTYEIEDGVYFDTGKLPDYGKMTGQDLQELKKSLRAGARVEMTVGKKNITDFALWKKTPEGIKRQMEWDSPWGKGFPGWHIECSAMSMKYLGPAFDIHSGGVDHIKIHHTNEIAQSEAATGQQFVRYWLHAGHLLVEGEKMSKSKKNFLRLKNLAERKFLPLALRYLFLTSSYRQQQNFTWKSMIASQIAYDELTDITAQLKRSMQSGERVSISEEKLNKADAFREEFVESINEDLNTSRAMSVLWKAVKSNIPPGDKYDLLLLFDEVLGLGLSGIETEKEYQVPPNILELINKRETMRLQKKYEVADRIRKEIEKQGYTVEDMEKGTKVMPVKPYTGVGNEKKEFEKSG